MNIKQFTPRQALNKAFLKAKPTRIEINNFKNNLIHLLDNCNDLESEEFHKNLLSDFLKKTYYEAKHFINTKGRNDLVIHNSHQANSSVGVIIEAKKPGNNSEMLSLEKLNTKALQELVLYYLRERISHKNLEVKHLIVTNVWEWFIFDVAVFERLFAQNKTLLKHFDDFENGRLADNTTAFFYTQIAAPFIAGLQEEIEFTYFNFHDYELLLRRPEQADDKQLIALFKLLSPEHLLKLPFANDSNTLNKEFYNELLHILGLTEVKTGSKKLIERKQEKERHSGSLLEDTIIQLDSLDKIRRLNKPNQFGNNMQERLFNVALELAITWINRILFLKLLEAQLISYHQGDKEYGFLSLEKLKNYNDLNSLFFQVLARKPEDRHSDVKTLFEKVPYLNSSLFEPTELEQVTVFISNLKDDKTLPVFAQTVLKDRQGKKLSGHLNTLEYLFRFLDAYDFGSEGTEEIQEDNRSLITASVLGLIFEKINGYKDGSYFTPGFITMYMSRETLRKAVVQKFKDYCQAQNLSHYEINSLIDIYELIPHKISIKQANDIVNSLKICDPAVGSGHFLVSVLNEIIAIKSELMILQDKNGKSLHRYQITVENDELVINDQDGNFFTYNYPNIPENQRVQETLFHEKQIIIENCLFGVDINPNSVKICRLRLWIELLKYAYYKNKTELETLPNIDINIKCGNSLISRFPIDADLGEVLKKKKWTIESYRLAVDSYRNAENKEQKREMEQLIADIKSDFTAEISANDPKVLKLQRLKNELFQMQNQIQLFEMTKKEKTDWDKKESALNKEIEKLAAEIEDIKTNKIFETAFEWRFEFPEVLNDNGDFIGFDIIIGNPPYGMISNHINYFLENYKTIEGRFDLYEAFIERGLSLCRTGKALKYIIPNTLLTNLYSRKLRQFLIENFSINEITNFGMAVFDEATVHNCILGVINKNETRNVNVHAQILSKEELLSYPNFKHIKITDIIDSETYSINIALSVEEMTLFNKVNNNSRLNDICHIRQCIKTGNNTEYLKKDSTLLSAPWKKTLRGKGIDRYRIIEDDLYVKYGDFLARNWKNKSFYETPKIALRETGQRIIAALDLENRYFLSSLYAIYPIKKFDVDYLKFLLGILNSKFATFYINKVAYHLTEGAFTKVRINQLGKLPVPKSTSEQQKQIIEYVDKLLFLKKENHTENTTDLENKIDQLVYQLYGLSEEEIKIIEKG